MFLSMVTFLQLNDSVMLLVNIKKKKKKTA